MAAVDIRREFSQVSSVLDLGTGEGRFVNGCFNQGLDKKDYLKKFAIL